MAAALVGGVLKVSDTAESNLGQVMLEQQKFALAKLNEARGTSDPEQKADKLIFLVDIGLFKDRLNGDGQIREMAVQEKERLKSGGQNWSVTPDSLGSSVSVSNFFLGVGPESGVIPI